MKLCDFSVLTRCEQIDLLYRKGVYIGKRKQNNYAVLLYQVDAFYVEVIYIKYRHFIHRIHAFSSTIGLDAYLDKIDVEDLVNCRKSI